MNARGFTMQRDLSRLLIIAAMLTACTKPAPPPPDNRLPRLDEVQSRLPPPPPQSDLTSGPLTRLAVLRIDLLASDPLTAAWTIAEQRGVEPSLGKVWRDNGLRCAVLHRTLYDAFVDALPPALGAKRMSFLTSKTPAALDFTPATREPRIIQLTLSGGGTTDIELPPGSSRLLITTEPADDNSVFISLTPHHHWPKPTVKPRTTLEQELDGRSFDLLRLNTRLRTDEVLIIGVPHPPPPEGSEDKQPEPPTEGEPPTTQPAAAFAPIPPEPLRIGRLILEGIKHKKNLQMIWMIAIEDTAQ